MERHATLLLEIFVEVVEHVGAARDSFRIVFGRDTDALNRRPDAGTSVRPNLSPFRSMSWMISAMARSDAQNVSKRLKETYPCCLIVAGPPIRSGQRPL
jgi:hypothetical protein